MVVAMNECLRCGCIWALATHIPPMACPSCESQEWDKRIKRDSSVPRPALRVQADSLGGHIFTSRVEDIQSRREGL